MGKQLYKNCLLCHSNQIKRLEAYKKNYLCECKNCDLVFCFKIPSEFEKINYYKNYSLSSYISPITIKRYNELLDNLEPFRKTNRIIDVGCGRGYFLKEAKKRGWEVYGTEFQTINLEYLTGENIKIKLGGLKLGDFKPEFFDVVTSFEVLEHINNPVEEIKIFNDILRKGGVLYLTTPNFNSLERLILKSEYNVINYPEHLVYYTKKTLNNLLVSQGFQKLKLKSTGLSITRIKTSKKMSSEKIVEKNNSDDKLRTLIEKNIIVKTLKTLINWGLNFFSIGNTLKALYIKR